MAVLATNEALRAPRMAGNANDAAYYSWQSEVAGRSSILTSRTESGNYCRNLFRELTYLARLPASVKSEPRAPEGDGYMDFSSFKLCGSAEYPRTGLTKGMATFGKEIERTLGWVAGLPAGTWTGLADCDRAPRHVTLLQVRAASEAAQARGSALPVPLPMPQPPADTRSNWSRRHGRWTSRQSRLSRPR